MSIISTLAVKIEADVAPFKRGIRQVREETAKTAKELGKAFGRGRAQGPKLMAGAAEKMGAAFAAAVNPITLTAGAVAGLSAGLASGVSAAADFERAMTNVASLGANSAEDLELLRQGVLKLAPAVGEGPKKLTEALYDIVSAGQQGQDALYVLEASAKAAKAGLTDTKTAADLVTTALNAYGLSASEAGKVTDIVQVAVQRGKTTWDEMAGAMGRVIPTAASVGIGMDELSAAVAALTAQGINTNEAVTGLKAALSNIIKPSAEAEKMAESLGIEFNAQALEAKGLSGVLADVMAATGGNTEEMAKLFGSVEALNAVLALTSDEGAAAMAEAQEAMASSAGATDKAFQTQAQTFDQTKQRFAAAVEAIKIQVGSVLLPKLTELLDWFTRSISTVQDWAQRIGEFFANLSGGSSESVEAASSAFSGFRDLMSGIFDALAALWTEVLKPVWDAIAPFIEGMLTGIGQIAGGALEGLSQIFQAFADFLRGDWTGAWEHMKKAVLAIGNGLVKGLASAFEGLGKTLGSVWDAIVNAVKSALNKAIDLVNRFISMLNKISISIPEVEIPGVGTVGGGAIGFNVPKIPALAEGGLVTKPTLALVGEAGPEVVIPLDRLQGEPSWVDKFGRYVERLVEEGVRVGVDVGGSGGGSSLDIWAAATEGA